MEILNRVHPIANNTGLSVVELPPCVDDKNSPKKVAILSKFEKALNLNSPFSPNWDASFVHDLFAFIADELVELNAKNIVVETTNDDSILIRSILQNKNLYVELFLTDEEPNDHDIVINLYENRNHIFGTAGVAKVVFLKIHKFLS